MPRQKQYKPRCPARDCSGGVESRLHRVKADTIELTSGVHARKKEEHVLYRCNYCGFVWFQRRGEAGVLTLPARVFAVRLPLGWCSD